MLRSYESLLTQEIWGAGPTDPALHVESASQSSSQKHIKPEEQKQLSNAERAKAQAAKEAKDIWKPYPGSTTMEVNQEGKLRTKLAMVEDCACSNKGTGVGLQPVPGLPQAWYSPWNDIPRRIQDEMKAGNYQTASTKQLLTAVFYAPGLSIMLGAMSNLIELSGAERADGPGVYWPAIRRLIFAAYYPDCLPPEMLNQLNRRCKD